MSRRKKQIPGLVTEHQVDENGRIRMEEVPIVDENGNTQIISRPVERERANRAMRRRMQADIRRRMK